MLIFYLFLRQRNRKKKKTKRHMGRQRQREDWHVPSAGSLTKRMQGQGQGMELLVSFPHAGTRTWFCCCCVPRLTSRELVEK